ncbi:MAG: Microtubule-associated protein RP/EB member 1 [Phylliscum demangeonii]|nr:MAG: Microtubule-associated protein RP/EB member 1 [Phylliscum demangeonii]
MGESRQELLAWLNNLLALNLTRVEQCGTGAAYCQVLDSIFMDIPMSRVKFNVNTEYAYIQNFKILQSAFARHQIDRLVPVEQLVKCKMQDNLEFLQWAKRFWDQYFPGGDYDALGRRKASGAPPSGAASVAGGRTSSGATTTSTTTAKARGATPTSVMAASLRGRQPLSMGSSALALQHENATLKESVDGLERERDFYFSKLRDIELLTQQAVHADPEIEKDEEGLVRQIQKILYSTTEGFIIPGAEADADDGVEALADDLETF